MNYADVMQQLEALGTEQNRKTYRRHGTPDPLFGVSFANLGKLKKQLKKNQALAEQLWASGNADARYLAVLIADPKQMDEADLDRWAAAIEFHAHAAYFAGQLVLMSPHAAAKALTWIESPRPFIAQAGWNLLAVLGPKSTEPADDTLAALLPRIEREIHASPNRIREAMNGALIGIGLRSDALAALATAAARRIGPVHVDHGETGCKTPDAVSYIAKARSRAKSQATTAR